MGDKTHLLWADLFSKQSEIDTRNDEKRDCKAEIRVAISELRKIKDHKNWQPKLTSIAALMISDMLQNDMGVVSTEQGPRHYLLALVATMHWRMAILNGFNWSTKIIDDLQDSIDEECFGDSFVLFSMVCVRAKLKLTDLHRAYMAKPLQPTN